MKTFLQPRSIIHAGNGQKSYNAKARVLRCAKSVSSVSEVSPLLEAEIETHMGMLKYFHSPVPETLEKQAFSRELLKAKDNSEWNRFYWHGKDRFMNAVQNDCHLKDRKVLDELYDEAIYALFMKILNGSQVDNLTGYLIGIGKRLYWGELKRTGRFLPIATLAPISEVEKPHWERLQQDESKALLRKAVKSLKGQCKVILEAFYYRGIKLIDLAPRMEELTGSAMTYASLRVAKNRCMKSLIVSFNAMGGV